MRSANRRTIRWLGAHMRLAWVAAVAVVVLFGASARAGSSYVYCRTMHEVRGEPCCAPTPHAAVSEVTPYPCCQFRLAAALPHAAPVPAPHIARSSLVGTAAPRPPSAAGLRYAAAGLHLKAPAPRGGAPPGVDLVRLRVLLR